MAESNRARDIPGHGWHSETSTRGKELKRLTVKLALIDGEVKDGKSIDERCYFSNNKFISVNFQQRRFDLNAHA